MRTLLPTKNCSILSITRQAPVVAAADEWEAASLEEVPTDEVLFEGRADALLFQSDVLTSTGTEVNLVTSKRMLIPYLCELKPDDRIEVRQKGQSDRVYRVLGLFLDSSDFHTNAIYSLTVQEA